MNILIKFPSRQRPEVFKTALYRYVSLADNINNIFFLFTLDKDDSCVDEYNKIIYDLLPNKNYQIDIGTSLSKINAINRGLNEFLDSGEFKTDIILLASDDMWPIIKGYDKDIIDNYKEDSYIWFYDGHQNRINTLSIMDIVYYNRFKYIYQPDYRSFFCDNEQTDVAIALGRCIKINKCIIRHEHPMCVNTNVKNDDLYKKNNAHWDHDKNLYASRKNNNFK